MPSRMTSRASPLSPVERDLTAVMLLPAAEDTSRYQSTSTGAEIPHNASSWELLDIMTASSSAPSNDDTQHSDNAVLVPVAATTIPAAAAADAEETKAALSATCTKTIVAAMLEASHPAVMMSTGVVAESGRVSPAHSESTDWSLVSTPSEVHLTCGVADLAQQTGGPLNYHPQNEKPFEDTAAAHGAMAVELLMQRPSVTAAIPSAHSPSQTFFLASVPPTSSPPTRNGVSAADGGWSATSYEEVRMHDFALATPVLSMLVEADLTMPALHGADKSPEKSTQTAPAIQLPTSPTSEENEENEVNEAEAASANVEARHPAADGVPLSSHKLSSSSPSSSPSLGTSWVQRVRHALHDRVVDRLPGLSPASPVAEERKVGQKTPQWTTRRLSFLSSSATSAVTTIALSAGLLPRSPLSPLPNTATTNFTAAGRGENTFTGRAYGASGSSLPSSSSPSSFTAVLASDMTQWWSWTRLRCADGSQHALRGLHSLCDYVWMDLKDHWYPQLRLVLGDHSCVAKVRRVQRARRRIADKRTERHAKTPADSKDAVQTSVAAVEQRNWRSVSAPCLIGGAMRTSSTSATEARHGGRCTGECAHGSRKRSRSSSSRHGLQLCYALTADAVASAAQGLLVFLL